MHCGISFSACWKILPCAVNCGICSIHCRTPSVHCGKCTLPCGKSSVHCGCEISSEHCGISAVHCGKSTRALWVIYSRFWNFCSALWEIVQCLQEYIVYYGCEITSEHFGGIFSALYSTLYWRIFTVHCGYPQCIVGGQNPKSMVRDLQCMVWYLQRIKASTMHCGISTVNCGYLQCIVGFLLKHPAGYCSSIIECAIVDCFHCIVWCPQCTVGNLQCMIEIFSVHFGKSLFQHGILSLHCEISTKCIVRSLQCTMGLLAA